ncbi:hypothetical protein BD560DRAFT_448025 [Blakeslea trispora]|nr:hypothetical protein BD560DRAFT_451423 [Blakeslea trispora]KAI8366121.1 hypothetical protein BD560DRAFT_448025 [Blakeslea trispora]
MFPEVSEICYNCFLDHVEDSVFKANGENNRNNSTGRYDENGIFSLSCARHGVPERMLSIYGGEGHKYALACVSHMLKQQKSEGTKYGIMYDIICLVKSHLERTFPYLMMNDTWYGVTAFHAYAHTMAYQVNYNPRYIQNFGYTDDGFVSMTRSMSKRNRQLLVTDAVDHFTYNKMLELPKQIKTKKEKNQKNLEKYKKQLEGVNTEKILEEWQKAKDLLSMKISKKFVKNILYKETEKNIINSKPFMEYLAAKKLMYYLQQIQNPDRMTKKRIERLRQETACFEVFVSRESYFKPVESFEDECIAHLTDQINAQVTNVFVILVKNYVFALSFKERQLSGNGKIDQQQQEQHRIDSLEAAVKKFPKESSLALPQDVMTWHKMCRAEEELQLLKRLTHTFLGMPPSTPSLSSPLSPSASPSLVAPSEPSADEVSISESILNESDDIVDGGKISSNEDNEDDLAPLISALNID